MGWDGVAGAMNKRLFMTNVARDDMWGRGWDWIGTKAGRAAEGHHVVWCGVARGRGGLGWAGLGWVGLGSDRFGWDRPGGGAHDEEEVHKQVEVHRRRLLAHPHPAAAAGAVWHGGEIAV